MSKSLKVPLKLVLPYLIISLLWIYLSDMYLDSLALNYLQASKIQTIKDCFCVSVTSIFLFFQLKRFFSIIDKQQAAQLKQKSLYRAIINNGIDIITLSSTEGVIIYISDNVTNYLGYSAQELINTTYLHLVHPEDIEILKTARIEVSVGIDASYTFEVRLLHKNGTYIWVETNLVNKIHDPQLQAFVGNTRIITQRKENERALRESEEMFRATFEQAVVGLAFLSLEGDLRKVNTKMTDICGYSTEEIFNLNFFKVTHPEDINVEQEAFHNLSTGAINQYSIIKRIIKKDGSYLWVDKKSSLIRDNAGMPQYILNALHDITDKVHAEQELNYKNKELDTYIYRSSHDLRGPISTIMGLSMLAETDVNDEKAVSYFEGITRVAKDMDKLLGNLMAVAQIKENKLTKMPIDIMAILNEITSKFSSAYQTDFKMDIEFKAGFTLYSDEGLLRIIFFNLLDNAFKFRNTGSDIHNVKLRLYCSDQKLKIVVSDSGIGVPIEEKEKMFDLYFRGRHAHQGNGVGLYIVKAAVEKLNGIIDINTQPGNGTEVVITLPDCFKSSIQ